MTGGEDSGAMPKRPESPYLAALILGCGEERVPAYAFCGLCAPPSRVWDDLTPEVRTAVRRLRLQLYAWFTRGSRFGSVEIEPVAHAVNQCGGWWPMPEIGPHMVRDGSGLDVPVVWGLEAFRRHLRKERAWAHDMLNDRDREVSFLKTLLAADELRTVLSDSIGAPYANGRPKPTAAAIARAWRTFERARDRSGGITILPVFGLPSG